MKKRSFRKKRVYQKRNRVSEFFSDNRWLFFLPVILSLVGLFFVFEASAVRSFNEYGDSFAYLKRQALWIALGSILMIAFSFFNYRLLYQFSVPLISVAIGLLLLVLLPGLGTAAGGARRWIDLGFFHLQPTEFAKIATIIYLAAWFQKREKKRILSFTLLLSVLMFLIILQPDMGTAVIIFSVGITMYYLAGFDLHWLIFLVPVAAGGFFALAKTSPYRLRRILAFFNPELDPLGITYHINQILISLSGGGLLGRGFGASRQKFLFLPEAHTDSIFAIVAEEVGFVGSLIVLIGLFMFLVLLYRVAQGARDSFGRLLAGGIFAFFSLQIVINLAGMVNLLPLTGVPLSFISYGGSHMLTSFVMTGVAINIARQSYT